MSTGKTVAIVQSNYIPWKGYFDLINMVDEFILFDDVQYTRRDWRNRNRIKTAHGITWLTIPVEVTGKYTQKIKDTRIADPAWAENHWKTIRLAYARAACFNDFEERLRSLYLSEQPAYLSEVNQRFLKAICDMLGITTAIRTSMEYSIHDVEKNERLIALCLQAGASRYISGPAARNYLDEGLFCEQGITVSWMDYSGYPEYPQVHPLFEHSVSIIDLILNTGKNARSYMKSFT